MQKESSLMQETFLQIISINGGKVCDSLLSTWLKAGLYEEVPVASIYVLTMLLCK